MIKFNSRILAIGLALIWLDSHLIGGDIGNPPPNVKLRRITDEPILPQRDKPSSKKQQFMRFIWEIQEKGKTFGHVTVQFDFIQARREWHIGVYEYDPIQKQKKGRENRIPWLPERGRFPADALNYAIGDSILVFGAKYPQERGNIATLHGSLDLWREVWLDFLKAVRETLRDGPPEEEREQPCGYINTNLWDFEAARSDVSRPQTRRACSAFETRLGRGFVSSLPGCWKAVFWWRDKRLPICPARENLERNLEFAGLGKLQ